ncbi:unnamed protein product, partial [Brachionus calyciflorus]
QQDDKFIFTLHKFENQNIITCEVYSIISDLYFWIVEQLDSHQNKEDDQEILAFTLFKDAELKLKKYFMEGSQPAMVFFKNAMVFDPQQIAYLSKNLEDCIFPDSMQLELKEEWKVYIEICSELSMQSINDFDVEKYDVFDKILSNALKTKPISKLDARNAPKIKIETELKKFPRCQFEKNNQKIETIIKDDSAKTSTELTALDNGLYVSEIQWLSSSHIDNGLEFVDRLFNRPFQLNSICFWRTWQIQNYLRYEMQVCLDPKKDLISDSPEEYQDKKLFLYDSLNNCGNAFALKPILKFLYPEKLSNEISMVEVIPQNGQNDCGLFALSYAYDLSDQKYMRQNFNNYVKYARLLAFKSKIVKMEKGKLKLITI